MGQAVPIVHWIQQKRTGAALSAADWQALVTAYMTGQVAEEQMAALAMAIAYQGMELPELVAFTNALTASGQQLDLRSFVSPPVVDKHSTGGVGDTTTLVLVPLVAAAGIPIAKLSGQSLGHTGGTVDKLAAIPGMRTQMSVAQFLAQVETTRVAVMAATTELAPADRRLYALRDRTATVDVLPLIASSIMSKKLAAGAPAMVLDVKVGVGAFLQEEAAARQLAEWMVHIGTAANREVVALVTDMEQPLGNAIGNAVEVQEAFTVLQGGGSPALRQLSLTLGGHMLHLGGLVSDPEAGAERLATLLANGQALDCCRNWIAAQGGNPQVVTDFALLPQPQATETCRATQTQRLVGINARIVAQAALLLGAGRERKIDTIDLTAGITLQARPGDIVTAGQPIATLQTSTAASLPAAATLLEQAWQWAPVTDAAPPVAPLVRYVIKAPAAALKNPKFPAKEPSS